MRSTAVLVVGVVVAGCGGAGDPAIPDGTQPCDDPSWWPRAVRSSSVPLEVHYPDDGSAARAREVLALLEDDWAIETGTLGFRAPLARAGCGTDDAVDVFLWPGEPEGYVDGFAADDATPQDDWATYMVLDPDGPYGGAALPTTLAHELDHMCQAADDWDEPIALLEATSTYVEHQLAPTLGVRATTAPDFQAHPEWSVDHDDDYETWFMYGAALYLEVLRDARLGGRADAVGGLWLAMRNTGPDNEPDWADAVRAAVAPASLEDTIVDLAIWRWYVGDRDDGRHLADAAALPPVALAGTATPATAALAVGPIDPLGMAYVALSGRAVTVEVGGLPEGLAVRAVALPGTGGADADELPAAAGVVDVPASSAARTLAIVVVPTAPYDPDAAPAPASLTLAFTWAP